MDKEIVSALAIAKQFAHHSNFAGSPRQAVADGYSAIDAILSALLLLSGAEPPRNHKRKLDEAKAAHPNVFAEERKTLKNGSSFSPGIEWGQVESLYVDWLKARYEAFDMPSSQAVDCVRLSGTGVNCAIRYIADKAGVDREKLDNETSQLAFGFRYSEVNDAVGQMHEHLFNEAEQIGEAYGAKLGMKLAATTNFCELDLVAGDQVTQEIIATDKKIGEECAKLYHHFTQIVEMLQAARLERIGASHNDLDEASVGNASPDFMLALKARYHGQTLVGTASRWANMLGKFFKGEIGGRKT